MAINENFVKGIRLIITFHFTNTCDDLFNGPTVPHFKVMALEMSTRHTALKVILSISIE